MSVKFKKYDGNRRAVHSAGFRTPKTSAAVRTCLVLSVFLLTAALLCGTAAAAISTSDQLQTALNKGGTVKLDKNLSDVAVTVKNTVTLDLNGYWITGKGNTSIITVNDTGKLTLTDTSVNGNGWIGYSAIKYTDIKYGGAVNNAGTFILKRGTITKCGARNGGGVYNKGTFTMSGGTISNNRAEQGGGVYNSGTFSMTGGKIIQCSSSSEIYDDPATDNPGTGGGVYNKGTFTMAGGSIAECSSQSDGGGIFNTGKNGIVKMTGGTITQCKTDSSGGGVDNENTFTMTGGSITKCSADDNGGCVYNGKNFVLSGGRLSESSAVMGGGVYNCLAGNFTMNGGTITGCSADPDWCGGGVYNNHSMKISGTAKIVGNKCGSTEDNLCLSEDDNAVITQNGNFSGNIGINQEVKTGAGKQFGKTTSGLTGAEHIFYDGKNLVGYASGTKLIWKKPDAAKSITVSGANVVAKGKSVQLKAKASPSTANQNFTWKSSKTSVATIDATGKVTGKAAGTVTITAKTRDGTGSKTYTFYVKPATTSIKITGSAAVAKGKSIQLKAAASPSDAYQKFTWTSDKTSVAIVDSSGKVTGKAVGKATITAKAKDGTGISKTYAVTVKTPVTSIKISGSAGVAKGKTIQLNAAVSPSSAYQKVTWSSSNKSVAAVDANGNVKGIAAGTATITAKARDGTGISKTFSVKVYAKPVASITLNTVSKTITKGKTFQLTATVNPGTAYQKLTWKSNNTSVATVSSTGLVTAKASGNAMIIVSSKDGSIVTNTCEVCVK